MAQRQLQPRRTARFTPLVSAAVVLAALAGGARPCEAQADQPHRVAVDGDSVVDYVLSCRKANRAFGPADQEYTDAAWNFPAVRSLLLLGETVADKQAVLEHGLGYPQGHGGYGHWFLYHRWMIRKLLGADDAQPAQPVALLHQGWRVNYYGTPLGFDGNWIFKVDGKRLDDQCRAAPQLGYYNLSSLYYLLATLEAAGRPVTNRDEVADYIRARQSPGGGFVDVRTADGRPDDEQAHVAHTFHAVASLKLLGADLPDRPACVRFVRSCQMLSGAFRFHPSEHPPGNYPDVYYTWAAVGTLELLGEKPERPAECVSWINSLQNHDGGFGDQPGWRSRLYSTYYAVHVLALLTGDARSAVTAKRLPRPQPETLAEGQYEIYQGLFKMPVCDPEELAELHERKFNLLALKSDDFSRAEVLREAIRAGDLPMDAVLCPEAYSHRAVQFGGALLHHVSNATLDPAWSTEERLRWRNADRSGRQGLAWADFQRQVIAPVTASGGLFYPEQDFELEYAYSAYDDAVHGKPGYNAVLCGFNWAPRDFVRVFPWRERYVDKLTPIADCDAHGDLAKWSPQLDHTRHLYLATGPTYADFLQAAREGRVVCVVFGPEGVDSGVSYYGPAPAVAYVKKRIDQWRWWP